MNPAFTIKSVLARIFTFVVVMGLYLGLKPPASLAASGIFAYGGGTKTAGQAFIVTITASGVDFDALQGQISVSGPVSIIAFAAGSATWLPGRAPTNGGNFVGITSVTNSLTVATITLKGTGVGSGAVAVAGTKLAKSGAVVSSDGAGTSFSIVRAPTPPGGVTVTSPSHPDPNQAYEARIIELNWTKASGVSGFSFLLDQVATTTPGVALSQATSVKYENKDIGTYYFHIRAQNGDGFGPTTHVKITIKEPDPKVDDSLTKASITGLAKATDFKTNLDDGTLQNFVIKGYVPPGYKTNLLFTPALTLPEGETLSVESNPDGLFEYLVDWPVKSGFYKVTVQGQKDKVLTPLSDPVKLELGVARFGTLRIVTDKDLKPRLFSIDYEDYTGPAQRRLVWWTIGSLGFLLTGMAATWWYFMIHRQKATSSNWKPKVKLKS